jgi:hypothetical protein
VTENPYAEAARLRKATRIAAVLRTQGTDAATARTLDADGRRAAEQLAVVNTASDTTWEIVARMLDNDAAIVAEVDRQTDGGRDPFASIR